MSINKYSFQLSGYPRLSSVLICVHLAHKSKVLCPTFEALYQIKTSRLIYLIKGCWCLMAQMRKAWKIDKKDSPLML